MPSYFVFDVETTGLLNFKLPADHPDQPRLAAVTFIMVNERLEVEDDQTFLVQPDGWTISEEITAINGLTTEECEQNGVPILQVLETYRVLVQDDHRVAVAFNAQFDLKQIRSELRRAGLPDLFEETPNICTMRPCRGLGIEKINGKKGQPGLADCYRHFYGTIPEVQHRSHADATSCLMVFRKLVQLGLAPEALVHYAKERPE